MQHRYIVWQGHFRGRRFKDMHIIDHEDKPICWARRTPFDTEEDIYRGRPDGYRLCRYCAQRREEFEGREMLRTWQALAETAK